MKTFLLTTSVIVWAFVSCNNDSEINGFGKDTPRYDIPLSTKSMEINAQVQKFSFGFFREIARSEKKNENFCISPLSASLCLGMVLNGTGGNTYEEIRQTLGFGGFDNKQINEYVQMMQTELPKLDGRTVFTNANSLWIKDKFPVLPSFIQQCRTYYNAEVSNEPFDKTSLDKINSWCKKKTNGLIPEIIKSIPENVVAYMINALYFKGVWKREFKKEDTKNEPFYCADGRTVQVPTMKQEQTHRMYNDGKVIAVELPYGNEAFSMVVFKPVDPQKQTIDQLIGQLDQATWTKWNKQMVSAGMTLYLPRFIVKCELNLIRNMQQMGIHDAFDVNTANFENMTKHRICIGLLKQKTYLELNEAGTEAAAVTIAGMMNSAGPSGPSAEVRFDHPFGYVLKEKSTEAILFAGRINLPE